MDTSALLPTHSVLNVSALTRSIDMKGTERRLVASDAATRYKTYKKSVETIRGFFERRGLPSGTHQLGTLRESDGEARVHCIIVTNDEINFHCAGYKPRILGPSKLVMDHTLTFDPDIPNNWIMLSDLLDIVNEIKRQRVR